MITGIGSSPFTVFQQTLEKKDDKDSNGYHAQFEKQEQLKQEEDQKKTGALPFKSDLSDEEKQRLKVLKAQLAQKLASAENVPSASDRQEIKKIEQEIQKLTGTKAAQSAADNIEKSPPGEKKKEDARKDREDAAREIQAQFLREHDMNMIGMPESAESGQNGPMAQFMQNSAINRYKTNAVAGKRISGGGVSFTI